MKTIKIMIAASEEMHEEKLEFSNLIEHLNEVLEPRGIELKRIKWNPETDGSIEEFKSKLKECEMCLTLYWRDLAGNSGQELDTAYQELKDGNNPRNLYVFFKEPTENLSEALRDFKANFVTHYGHFFCRFENVDTMNLHFILQFEAYQNKLQKHEEKLIAIKDGIIKIGGKDFVKMENVPFAALNKDYQKMRNELIAIGIQVADARKRYNDNPESEKLEDEFILAKNKQKKLAEEFERYQNHLYEIALNFTKIAGDNCSERMKKARKLFEEGNVVEADQILDLQEMKQETEQEKKQYEQNIINLELKIEEFRLKADTVMANTTLNQTERFAVACDAYEQALSLANTIKCDELIATILFDYAILHESFDMTLDAINYYKSSLTIYQKQKNNFMEEAYIYVRLGILFKKISLYNESEASYLKCLEITRNISNYNVEELQIIEADVLSYYGELLCSLRREEEAESAYIDSLMIYQGLEVKNGSCYRDKIALLFSGIGILRISQERYKEAENVLLGALEIHKQLAETNPESYLDSLAVTLSCLGHLFIETRRYEKAEEKYKEALDIYQKLVKDNPLLYRVSLAETLCDIGNILSCQKRFEEAERTVVEAMKLYKRMQGEGSDSCISKVPETLQWLGKIKVYSQKYEEAEKIYKEAVDYCERWQQKNLNYYSVNVAQIHNNLGELYLKIGKFKESNMAYNKALKIYRRLKKEYPNIYNDDIKRITKKKYLPLVGIIFVGFKILYNFILFLSPIICIFIGLYYSSIGIGIKSLIFIFGVGISFSLMKNIINVMKSDASLLSRFFSSCLIVTGIVLSIMSSSMWIAFCFWFVTSIILLIIHCIYIFCINTFSSPRSPKSRRELSVSSSDFIIKTIKKGEEIISMYRI